MLLVTFNAIPRFTSRIKRHIAGPRPAYWTNADGIKQTAKGLYYLGSLRINADSINEMEYSDNKNSCFTITITERQAEIDHGIRQEKSDLTRLKTLLRNYKNRIITNLYIKFPHLTITHIFNETNKAVNHLISGL